METNDDFKNLDTYVDFSKLQGLSGIQLSKARQKLLKNQDNVKLREKVKRHRFRMMMRARMEAGLPVYTPGTVLLDIAKLSESCADAGLEVISGLADAAGQVVVNGILDPDADDKVRKVDMDSLMQDKAKAPAGNGKARRKAAGKTADDAFRMHTPEKKELVKKQKSLEKR